MEVLQFQMGLALLLPLAFSTDYSGIFSDIYMQNPYQSFYEISQKPLEFDIVEGSM